MVRGVEEAAGFAGKAVERALLGQGIDVTLDGKGAGESKVGLNFAERGRDTVLALMGLDEIKDFLLTGGEDFWHSVQLNTPGRKCNFVFSARRRLALFSKGKTGCPKRNLPIPQSPMPEVDPDHWTADRVN
jgi:hypothetical protein